MCTRDQVRRRPRNGNRETRPPHPEDQMIVRPYQHDASHGFTSDPNETTYLRAREIATYTSPARSPHREIVCCAYRCWQFRDGLGIEDFSAPDQLTRLVVLASGWRPGAVVTGVVLAHRCNSLLSVPSRCSDRLLVGKHVSSSVFGWD